MAILQCLDTVRFGGFTAGLLRILATLEETARSWIGPPDTVWITSGSDGQHKPGSQHYHLRAIDVRTKNFPTHEAATKFYETWQATLPSSQFTLIWEDRKGPNQHWHCQVKRGTTYP